MADEQAAQGRFSRPALEHLLDRSRTCGAGPKEEVRHDQHSQFAHRRSGLHRRRRPRPSPTMEITAIPSAAVTTSSSRLARSRSSFLRLIAAVRAGRSPNSCRRNRSGPALAHRRSIPAAKPDRGNSSGPNTPNKLFSMSPKAPGAGEVRPQEMAQPPRKLRVGAKVDEPKLAAPQLLAPAPPATPAEVEQVNFRSGLRRAKSTVPPRS
jgi:hypothetical protein